MTNLNTPIVTIHNKEHLISEAARRVTIHDDGTASGELFTQFGKFRYWSTYDITNDVWSSNMGLTTSDGCEIVISHDTAKRWDRIIDEVVYPFEWYPSTIEYGTGATWPVPANQPLPNTVGSPMPDKETDPDAFLKFLLLHPYRSGVLYKSLGGCWVIDTSAVKTSWSKGVDLYSWSIVPSSQPLVPVKEVLVGEVLPPEESVYVVDRNFILNLLSTALGYIRNSHWELLNPNPPTGETIRIKMDDYYTSDFDNGFEEASIYLTTEYTKSRSHGFGVSHVTHCSNERIPLVIVDLIKQTLLILWPSAGSRETAWSLFHLTDSDLYDLMRVPQDKRIGCWKAYAKGLTGS